jgi:hypothetical protein
VESDNEAVELANDTDYGFSTSIRTANLMRAFEIGRKLEVGQVQGNGLTVYGDDMCDAFHIETVEADFASFCSEPGCEEYWLGLAEQSLGFGRVHQAKDFHHPQAMINLNQRWI